MVVLSVLTRSPQSSPRQRIDSQRELSSREQIATAFERERLPPCPGLPNRNEQEPPPVRCMRLRWTAVPVHVLVPAAGYTQRENPGRTSQRVRKRRRSCRPDPTGSRATAPQSQCVKLYGGALNLFSDSASPSGFRCPLVSDPRMILMKTAGEAGARSVRMSELRCIPVCVFADHHGTIPFQCDLHIHYAFRYTLSLRLLEWPATNLGCGFPGEFTWVAHRRGG